MHCNRTSPVRGIIYLQITSICRITASPTSDAIDFMHVSMEQRKIAGSCSEYTASRDRTSASCFNEAECKTYEKSLRNKDILEESINGIF